MTLLRESLPLVENHSPGTAGELAEIIATAVGKRQAVYPIGGGTSLDYGLPPSVPGIGLSLGQMARVVDFPARDMTITVEPGITIAALAETLAAEGGCLPIDVPHSDRATLGGAIATAWSGPRRYGNGTWRDVIGLTAIDGRGKSFRGGGRVVKNVAGYDFCRMMIGSLGTLGVIAEVSLKVKPLPEHSAVVVADLGDIALVERLLAALVTSAVSPTAIELVAGPEWLEHEALGLATAGTRWRLVVGLEGRTEDVAWMVGQLEREWEGQGVAMARRLNAPHTRQLWRDLSEFSSTQSPLVLKLSVLPSRTAEIVELVGQLDPTASIMAHAGNGIVIVRFGRFDAADVSKILLGKLRPSAELQGGRAVVLSTTLEGLTRQALWGSAGAAQPWMAKVKAQFDPQDLLNPGRFLF